MTPKRFIVTRVVKNPQVPKRYQRSGWIAFDTKYPLAQLSGVWSTKAEAQDEADRCNQRYQASHALQTIGGQ